jgi:hypothetical protein
MRWIAAALLVAGCDSALGEKTQYCPDTGYLCPENQACANAPVYCGPTPAVTACKGAGKQNFDSCRYSSTGTIVDVGACFSGICYECSPDREGCSSNGEWVAMTPAGAELDALLVLQRGDAYAAGKNNTLLDYDGSMWLPLSLPPVAPGVGFISIWGTSFSELFVLAENEHVYRYDGTTWIDTSTNSIVAQAMWGASAADVFAVGPLGSIWHYDGSGWTAMASGTATAVYNGVWGTATRLVFAVGYDRGSATVAQYDGAGSMQWNAAAIGGPFATAKLDAVWGSGTADVYAVGLRGTSTTSPTIIHFDGATWSAVPTTITVLDVFSVWGSGPSDVFTGGPGRIIHFDGGSWSEMPTPPSDLSNSINAIAGSSADDVFAVGKLGTIWHYTGAN